MGRGKLKLKLIEDKKQRLKTYCKRAVGLRKKTYELATLCGVQALVACVGPTGKVDTWPETDEEIKLIIAKCRSFGPAYLDKHRLDLVDYLLAQIAKQRSLNGLSEEALRGLYRSVNMKIEAVKEKMLILSMIRNCDEGNLKKIDEKIETWDDFEHIDYLEKVVAVDKAQTGVDGILASVPHEASELGATSFGDGAVSTGYECRQIGFDQGPVAFDKCPGSVPVLSKMDFGSVQGMEDASFWQKCCEAPNAFCQCLGGYGGSHTAANKQ